MISNHFSQAHLLLPRNCSLQWQRHTYHSSGELGPRPKLQEMDNKNPYLPCFNIFIIAKQCAFIIYLS